MIRPAFYLLFALSCLVTRCGEPVAEEKKAPEKQITEETAFANSLLSIPATGGVVGFFNVPEMLCLSIIDSAAAPQVAKKVERNYALLDEDLRRSRAIRNGCYGQISYSNDTANFKFECFVLIAKVPAVSPKHSRVVVLEANHMLVYNYFGPYHQLYVAYGELRKYMEGKNLAQNGPLREYYITDPRREPDQRKWRTVLMVPARRLKP